MSLASGKVFTLAAVVTPAGTINQISQHNVNPGLNNVLLTTDGQVDPTFAAVLSEKPVLTFTTSAISRALGFAGWSGLAVTAGVDAWFQQIAQGGLRSGSGAHSKFTMGYGILVPTSLTWEHDGVATIDYMMWARSNDGTTAPLGVTVAQSLPALVTTREAFTAGPASINGVSVQVTGGRIDFGFEPVNMGSNGEAYDTFCAIMRRTPTITLRTPDVTLAGPSGVVGVTAAQTATDSLVYLRALNQNGTRVADATAAHIKFSVDDGIVSARSVGGSDGRPQELVYEIQPTYDGTNENLAVSLGVAIT